MRLRLDYGRHWVTGNGWNREDAGTAAGRIEIAGRFVGSSKRDDYRKLCEEYPFIFGHATQTENDVEAVCDLLKLAVAVCGLANSPDDIATEELFDCSIYRSYSGSRSKDGELLADSFGYIFSYTIESEPYTEWLGRATKTMNKRYYGSRELCMRLQGGELQYVSPRESDAMPNEHGVCREILRQLITAHLADVGTVCAYDDDGESATPKPAQLAFTGISTLWLGLVERLSGGRAFRCDACGKPCVAYGERRHTVFCSDACRKWKSKHPGVMRDHWYYEKR